MLRRRGGGVWGAGLLALALACGGPGGSSAASVCEEETDSSPLPEGALICPFEGSVTVEVTGAERIRGSGTHRLRAIEMYRGELPEETWFANLGIELPVKLTERRMYRVGFDIAPSTYRGADTYELTEEPPEVGGFQGTLSDKVFLEVTILEGEAPGIVRYDRMVDPCTAVVSDHMTRGSLECPELADEEGNGVSLTFSWEPA